MKMSVVSVCDMNKEIENENYTVPIRQYFGVGCNNRIKYAIKFLVSMDLHELRRIWINFVGK